MISRRDFRIEVIYVLFSGKIILIYREGLFMVCVKWFWKNFVFAHSRFYFAPLQVLGSDDVDGYRGTEAVLTDHHLCRVLLLLYRFV